MTKKIDLHKFLVVLPLLIVPFFVFLVQSPYMMNESKSLSLAISLDLILTMPLAYFLIIRKRTIPKYTVLSVFILGLLVASFLLPNESWLQQARLFLVPVLELGVVTFIIIKIRKVVKSLKAEKRAHSDFYDAIRLACNQSFPKRVAALMSMEMASIYYALFKWKKAKPLATNEYTYFKKSGVKAVIGAFMFIILVETMVIHIVLERWSVTAAWILSFLSLYTCLQLLALMKSMNYRRFVIDKTTDQLYLRYGFFSEANFPLADIEFVEETRKTLPEDKSVTAFSPLGHLDGHNLILHLKAKHTLTGIYGIIKTFDKLAIYVDDKERFVNEVKT